MTQTAHEIDPLEMLSGLVRERRAGLCALARHEGATPEDAFDCVQEALCTFLNTLQTGTAPPEREAWAPVLATMVRNAARNKRRRHFIARPHVELDRDLGPAAPGAAIDDLVVRAEEHVRLRECVQELCEIQKSVVTLRMLEEQAGEDVARALGISPGHVAVLLHRAKAALRACMTDHAGAASSR